MEANNGLTMAASTSAAETPEFDSSNVEEEASEALAALRQFLTAHPTPKRTLQVCTDDEEPVAVTVPTEAFRLLVDILAEMAEGNSVHVVPTHADLTTQRAAEMLGVSRPYLIKLLEQGDIPYRMVGTHRKIKVKDLFKFKAADDAKRKTVADAMASEAQELGLGYE